VTHAQNLLLFWVQDNPANSNLHLIVAFIWRASTAQITVDLISVLEEAHQVTPATIHNDSFKLIDTLASEGAALCSEDAQPAQTILCNELCKRGLIVDFIPTTQILCWSQFWTHILLWHNNQICSLSPSPSWLIFAS
jgi:hypothetical protein